MWRIYKEGQGKWARGLVAFIIGIGGVFAVVSLHDMLPAWRRFDIPVVNWSFDYRFFIEGPILIAVLVLGVWLYNRPATADFLIETENELKNKVTWPSKEEEIRFSLVVVVTVFLLGVFIFTVDFCLTYAQDMLFPSQEIDGKK
ncbi:MAG TPA: preprotein translocase subunit SecE [Planctomycetota bacterium]|nr:preprotein translocase subunit SecE [Planctomycetota bacterium]